MTLPPPEVACPPPPCPLSPLQAHNMTGTAVARIMHGLSSAAYPTDQWVKCGFWGK